MNRRRDIGAAPVGAPTPVRLTEAAWRIAGGAPETPIVGTSVGPLAAAFSAAGIEPGEARWVHGALVVEKGERAPSASEREPEPEPEPRAHLWVTISIPGPEEEAWATAQTPEAGSEPSTLAPLTIPTSALAPPALEAGSPPDLEGPRSSGPKETLAGEAQWWAKHGLHWHRHASLLALRGTGALGAPDAPGAMQIDLPPPDAASYVAQAEDQQHRGDLEAAALSIGKAQALDLDVLGGVERRASIREVLDRARQLVSPCEAATRRSAADHFDRAMYAFHDAWHAGRRLDAVRALRARIRESADGRLVARLVEAERSLAMHPRQHVRMDGEDVTLVFGAPAWLGRADCAIEVRSPLVSRTHLLFRHDARGVVVVDRVSANGTFRGGARLDRELVVEDTVDLRLGGEILVQIQAFGQAARVKVGSEVTWLALGETLEWAGARLSRFYAEDVHGLRLEAAAGEPLAFGGVGVGSLELARGDRVTAGVHVLEIPST